MKISFPKYGPGELLIKKLGAPSIIWSMMIGFFAGLCGSYLLKNHFWLLMIAVLSAVSILLCLGAAMVIFLNLRKVDGAPTAIEAPSASIKACRELHRSGIIGPEKRFWRPQFSIVRARRPPRS
jgi:hypothetical protein